MNMETRHGTEGVKGTASSYTSRLHSNGTVTGGSLLALRSYIFLHSSAFIISLKFCSVLKGPPPLHYTLQLFTLNSRTSSGLPMLSL
ncbi:hypothetical protein E2C01_039766 [Portunus trituberculatus]|uniref:Uncharacterized protein n=1 Tax=Portunus trituberculatus TaxID=210409 RepID=A0A5B7FL14_PORTR|nr:hypothetical protein [Portunus trituberculatus]